MLTKFESKSNRVKGLSFHSTRPWILASLHNGAVQLWDYRMCTLLDKFEEHDGPVRGIHFHKSQPLFVSGGDDYKIKVWNYKLRRCLFTLLGHLDYIRTVEFHHEYPWILSASDDQTIRIWNWQSRQCISVLTGHNHYVMCASFHPKDDLVVSASLDQTVRVWDTSGLRKKNVRGAPVMDDPNNSNAVMSRVNADLFGGTDAVVKYVLEGHDRGVNWATFHKTLPLIISAADDRQVKLWRMNETRAWEVDTMRGHTQNVSCVIFHPRAELIVSNSEDRSIRVWDIAKRMGVQTFRRENDRFWILAAHPDQNLLAAGHDTGMIVFKLERERPAHDAVDGQLYVVKDRYLRLIETQTGRDVPLVSIRRPSGPNSAVGSLPRSLEYNKLNPAETNVLIFSNAEGGSYDLFTFPKDAKNNSASQDSRHGSCLAAVFIARNRFAVLEKNRQISIKSFDNLSTKKINPPNPGADGLFSAGIAGRVLIRAEEKITLFEIQSRRTLAELTIPKVKYVVWNKDASLVALICKHLIVICDRQLKQLCSVTETVRVKGGTWNSDGVFIYSTLNHIKYTLINGDSGIIRTLDVPVYIYKAVGDSLHCLDRECKPLILSIDTTECKFKLALMRQQYGEVMKMIRSSKFCGRAIIGYLKEKGYPEVALHFVEDRKTRFNLALECGNIDAAHQAAEEVDDEECWAKLGREALRQGNRELVEKSYQKTKDFERLSFLYLITGNRENLKRMLFIAERRKDVMSQFHNALYLGNVPERVKLLEQAGQVSLAYVTAKSHGLAEDAERLHAFLVENEIPIPALSSNKQTLLLPPVPVSPVNFQKWPLLDIPKKKAPTNTFLESQFDALVTGGDAGAATAVPSAIDDNDSDLGFGDDGGNDDDLDLDDGAGWGDMDDDLDLGDDLKGDDLDLDLGDGVAGGADDDDDVSGIFVAPTPGNEVSVRWCENSSLAADHAAAGVFDQAMKLLNRQIGVVNFAPLKPYFIELYMSTRCQVLGMPSVQSMKSLLQRAEGADSLPEICVRLAGLKKLLTTVAYRKFMTGDFPEALATFRSIIHQIPLLAVEKHDVRNVKEMLTICREYVVGILLQLAKIANKDPDMIRKTELAALLTHCQLEPRHMQRPLTFAMSHAVKLGNFITAASFARRLLELPDMSKEVNADLKRKTLKVVQKSEQEARNQHQLNYDESNPFVICSHTFVPLYKDSKNMVKCPYCGAYASGEFKDKVCNVCQVAQLGVETIGLVCTADN